MDCASGFEERKAIMGSLKTIVFNASLLNSAVERGLDPSRKYLPNSSCFWGNLMKSPFLPQNFVSSFSVLWGSCSSRHFLTDSDAVQNLSGHSAGSLSALASKSQNH